MHETRSTERPKAVLVGIQLPQVSDAALDASLTELKRLVETLGYDVVGRVHQRRSGVGSAEVLGTGKLVELAGWTGGTGIVPRGPRKSAAKGDNAEDDDDGQDEYADDESLDDEHPADESADGRPTTAADGAPKRRAGVVVVDHELSPMQLRNLEKATSAEVLDRTGVIVEIFHRHASSREARFQVEIARLTYVAPRLRESSNTERQRGGIGGKGAGESAVELDRRKIRDRIAELRRELASIEGEREVRRARRREQQRVALVGYTNAGKSSWMRALTGSEVLVADKLFATLDTTVRTLVPETKPRILISDTVGFIKKLPHDLVASFRSTLDEAIEASLLLHVVDASDADFRSQYAVTREVLDEIGASDVSSQLILNKVDKIDAEQRAALEAEFPDAWFLSAKRPDDVATLHGHLVAFFARDMVEERFVIPYTAGSLVGELHEKTDVLEMTYEEDGFHLRVRALPGVIERFRGALR